MDLILFTVIFSFLLIHEMDAIRTREWKMFIVLKDMSEEAAYKVFTVLHLPLYFVTLYIVLYGGTVPNLVMKIVIDIFLIAHSIIHFCFRKHKDNAFKSLFSKIMIYSMAAYQLYTCSYYSLEALYE